MATFLRYEKKFLVTLEQKEALLNELKSKELITPDENSNNGIYHVYNIYFDDTCNTSIRHSVSRPSFKEKMRIRSYQYCDDEANVYLEVKKKLNGYGSKRRIKVPFKKALNFIETGAKPSLPPIDEEQDYLNNQILSEMESFLKTVKLKPFIYIEVEREAYYFTKDKDLRITFDSKIEYRYDELNFHKGVKNTGKLLEDNQSICEIKFKGAIPYELATLLTNLGIYRTHFSKVGKIYEQDDLEIVQRILNKNKRN